MRQKPMNKMNFKGKEIETILDILWAIKNDDKHYFYSYGRDCLKSLVKESDSLPCVTQWVAVEDRLPVKNQKVLVIQNPKTTATREALFSEFDGKNFLPPLASPFNKSDIRGKWVDIIYWQPLPEPPCG
jgi:hypothetical protein